MICLDSKNSRRRTVGTVLLVIYACICAAIAAWQFASGARTLRAMRAAAAEIETETKTETAVQTAASPMPSAAASTAPTATPTATPTAAPTATACVHSYGEWVTVVAATATSNGLDTRECIYCGATEERVTNPTPTIDTSSGNESLKTMFEFINAERAAAGLAAVYYCSDIQSAADLRAAELNEYYDMQHNRPDGREAVTVFADLGITYTMAGENYTLGPPTAEMAMEAFMNSEGHRALILNANAKGVALSVAPNDEFGLSWVQIFVY